MKTKRTNARTLAAGLLAIAVVALAVIGCKQEPPPPPTVTIGGKAIPVYKLEGVSDADFNTTIENIRKAIPYLNPGTITNIEAKVTKIEIGGDNVTINNGVLRIKANTPFGQFAGWLDDLFDN